MRVIACLCFFLFFLFKKVRLYVYVFVLLFKSGAFVCAGICVN